MVRYATLLILGLLAGVAVLEGGLRLVPSLAPAAVQISSPALEGLVPATFGFDDAVQVSIPDAYLGLRLRPQFDRYYRAPAPYESFPVRLVRLGKHNVGIRREQPAPAEVLGVAVGDSFVFGWGVPADHVWVTVLERQIGLPIVNLGVPGYSSIQATRFLGQYGLELRPRLVLWGFTPNDFVDSARFARWEAAARPQDFNVWLRDDRGAGGVRRWAWLRNWLRLHLVTYEWVRVAVRSWQNREVRYRSNGLDFIFQSSEIDVMPTPLADEGALLTREAIRRAAELAREAGATLVVVAFPAREQVYWPILKRLFPERAQGNPHWRTTRVVEFCREAGVPVVDLTPVLMQRAAAGEQLYFRLERHLNARGNALVADAVFAYLQAAGMIMGRQGGGEKSREGRVDDGKAVGHGLVGG